MNEGQRVLHFRRTTREQKLLSYLAIEICTKVQKKIEEGLLYEHLWPVAEPFGKEGLNALVKQDF